MAVTKAADFAICITGVTFTRSVRTSGTLSARRLDEQSIICCTNLIDLSDPAPAGKHVEKQAALTSEFWRSSAAGFPVKSAKKAVG